MKKIAFLLAVVTIILTFTSCGYRCHNCGDFENLKRYGNNIYCSVCIENGEIEPEDLKAEIEKSGEFLK